MHMYAQRIMKEHVTPKLDLLLDRKEGITETEFRHLKDMVCLSKELLECDVMLKKLGSYPKESAMSSMPPSGGGMVNL